MEKGPKPFSEEKAKEIMEAEGLEERSQSEQDAFEAGYESGIERDKREKERVHLEKKERKIEDRIEDVYQRLTEHISAGIDFEEWDTNKKGNPRLVGGLYFEDIRHLKSVKK